MSLLSLNTLYFSFFHFNSSFVLSFLVPRPFLLISDLHSCRTPFHYFSFLYMILFIPFYFKYIFPHFAFNFLTLSAAFFDLPLTFLALVVFFFLVLFLYLLLSLLLIDPFCSLSFIFFDSSTTIIQIYRPLSLFAAPRTLYCSVLLLLLGAYILPFPLFIFLSLLSFFSFLIFHFSYYLYFLLLPPTFLLSIFFYFCFLSFPLYCSFTPFLPFYPFSLFTAFP